jgi:hypothetical protein
MWMDQPALRSLIAVSPRDQQKGWCAKNGSDDANRQFGRVSRKFATKIGAGKQQWTCDGAEAEYGAQVFTDEASDDVRHHQSDKADRAGNGDG